MTQMENDNLAISTASLHEADLRQHPRHLCIDGGVLRLAVRPEFRGRRGLLVDVSAGGIGFLLEEPLEAGAVLAFQLQGPGRTETISRVARVRHSRPHVVPEDAPWIAPTPKLSRFFRQLFGKPAQEPSDQAWLIGCQFDRPLSEAEIIEVLEQLRPSR